MCLCVRACVHVQCSMRMVFVVCVCMSGVSSVCMHGCRGKWKQHSPYFTNGSRYTKSANSISRNFGVSKNMLKQNYIEYNWSLNNLRTS